MALSTRIEPGFVGVARGPDSHWLATYSNQSTTQLPGAGRQSCISDMCLIPPSHQRTLLSVPSFHCSFKQCAIALISSIALHLAFPAGDAMVPLADIFDHKASVVLLGDAWGVAEPAADPHPHCTLQCFTLCCTLLYCTGIYCTVLQFAGDAMVPLADIFNQKASVVLLGDAGGVAVLAAVDPHSHCTIRYFFALPQYSDCTSLYHTVLYCTLQVMRWCHLPTLSITKHLWSCWEMPGGWLS